VSHTASSVTEQIRESIRVHHASGHFTRDEAHARLRVAGFGEMTPEAADDLLDEPVDPSLFGLYGTHPRPAASGAGRG
jgi:hypothetical protein